MTGDKLVISFKGVRVAIDTKTVAGIVSAEKTSFLPGQSGFIGGVISLRGEPVAVVDLQRAMGEGPGPASPQHRIVVVRGKGRILGIDIGSSEVSFIWDEEMKDAATGPPEMKFSRGVVEFNGARLHLLDWEGLFAEATRILSTDGAHV